MQAELAGAVGNELLRRFMVTFDYAGQKVYLEPNASLREPFEEDMSGMAMVLKDGNWSVAYLIPNSPAQKAGVARGDRILEIDGKPVNSLGLAEISRRMKRPGAKVSILLEREGKRIRVVFVLKRLI